MRKGLDVSHPNSLSILELMYFDSLTVILVRKVNVIYFLCIPNMKSRVKRDGQYLEKPVCTCVITLKLVCKN